VAEDRPVTKTLLVLGGARSGKSRYAQKLAEGSGLLPVLVATAVAGDTEMAERIARHKAERAAGWRVIEEPLALASVLRKEAGPEKILVVDCATLWLSNLLLQGLDLLHAANDLVAAAVGLEGPVIFVSNEVGQGIVPDNALSRAFRDAQGRLNQSLAAACDRVILMNAGLPLCLKPAPDISVRF
jgi:adenosylcobinamide kinase/adenosylcobinamide-phosphate guanylyltransferase